MPFTYIPDAPPSDIDQVTAEWVNRELTRISDELIAASEAKWDDLRFPAANLKSGSSGVPSWDNTNGLQEFDIDDYLFCQVQLPHAWKVGSTLKPHFHWSKITSAVGNVNWQLEYKWAKLGQVIDGSFTVLNDETPDVSDEDTAYHHALTAVGEIIPPADVGISDMLICKLSRIAAVGTEYGTDAALFEFDIHYQIDSFGSDIEYIKHRG